MQFFSIPFLFYFLPLFLGIYYIVPDKEKTLVTLIGSIVFFLLQDFVPWWHIVVLLGVVVAVYWVGRQGRHYRTWAIVILSLALAFFRWWQNGKYIPAGLGFCALQLIAYLADLGKSKLDAEKSLLSYAAQNVMFPKVLAGPLMNPRSLQAQMHHPRGNLHRFHSGLQELIIGLAMKTLLANPLAALWQEVQAKGFEGLPPLIAWIALLAYAMNLYFNFNGYSTMAVGLGKMMGFELPENFAHPYAAASVSDFFRRWHITLRCWFRDYAYIPLGGNQKGKWRTAVNVLIVWLLVGLWLGPKWNFLLWSLVIGVCIVLEKLWLEKPLKKLGLLSRLYTIVVVVLGWAILAAESPEQLLSFLMRLFCFGQPVLERAEILRFVPILLFGGVFLTPYPRRIFDRLRECLWVDVVLFLLFWVCVYVTGTVKQTPFIFFGF